MARKQIVAGNWKMNLLLNEAEELFEALRLNSNGDIKADELIIAPSYVYLPISSKYLTPGLPIKLAAQDCASTANGAHTGEVSATQLKSLGVSHVILGHSERRTDQGESNELINAKLTQVLDAGLTPIVCVGESLHDRKSENHLTVVRDQLKGSLKNLSQLEMQHVILAYEPVWAIGTGETATPEQAQEVHADMRSFLASSYDSSLSDKISILYGGSCKPSNAAELFAKADIDGGLIGGASLKAADFIAIANSF